MTEDKAPLMKVGILGHDRKTVLLRVSPHLFIIRAFQTDLADMP